MHIQKIQKNYIGKSFCAGKITLEGISANEIMSQFDNINQIATQDNIDIRIGKWTDKKEQCSLYWVSAMQKIEGCKDQAKGHSLVRLNNETLPKQVADILYQESLNAVNKLSDYIEYFTGKKPAFLKYIQK